MGTPTLRLALFLGLTAACGRGPQAPTFAGSESKADDAKAKETVVYSETFQIGEAKTESYDLNVTENQIVAEFLLTGIYATTEQQFVQSPRPIVTQSMTSAALQTSFPLNLAFDPRATTVTLNGQAVATTLYTIDLAKKTITFTSALVDGTTVTLTGQEDRPNYRQFMLGASFRKAEILVNGVLQLKQQQKFGRDLITLDQVPADNSVVTIRYERLLQPDLTYAVKIFSAEPPSLVGAFDQMTLPPFNLTYDDGQITIASDNFLPDAKVQVPYTSDYYANGVITVPPTMPSKHLDVKFDDKTCKPERAEAGKIKINCDTKAPPKGPKGKEKALALALSLPGALLPVHLSWTGTAFSIPSDLGDKGEWRVKMDGKDFKDFEVRGNLLFIVGNLPAGAEVEASLVTKGEP